MEREFLEGLALEPEVLEAVWERVEAMKTEHAQTLRRRDYEFALERAVSGYGGRNATAIRALLDEQAILDSEDMASAARQAVGRLKREHGYLFQTGTALSERTGSARVRDYSVDELGSMTMAEYKRARRIRN